MEEVKSAFENGVPVDFRVSFSNQEIVKMIGVIIILTVAVVVLTLTVKKVFYK